MNNPTKDQLTDLLIQLMQASLELNNLNNLKPHVSDEQLQAADRIKNHLNKAANIIDTLFKNTKTDILDKLANTNTKFPDTNTAHTNRFRERLAKQKPNSL